MKEYWTLRDLQDDINSRIEKVDYRFGIKKVELYFKLFCRLIWDDLGANEDMADEFRDKHSHFSIPNDVAEGFLEFIEDTELIALNDFYEQFKDYDGNNGKKKISNAFKKYLAINGEDEGCYTINGIKYIDSDMAVEFMSFWISYNEPGVFSDNVDKACRHEKPDEEFYRLFDNYYSKINIMEVIQMRAFLLYQKDLIKRFEEDLEMKKTIDYDRLVFNKMAVEMCMTNEIVIEKLIEVYRLFFPIYYDKIKQERKKEEDGNNNLFQLYFGEIPLESDGIIQRNIDKITNCLDEIITELKIKS